MKLFYFSVLAFVIAASGCTKQPMLPPPHPPCPPVVTTTPKEQLQKGVWVWNEDPKQKLAFSEDSVLFIISNKSLYVSATNDTIRIPQLFEFTCFYKVTKDSLTMINSDNGYVSRYSRF